MRIFASRKYAEIVLRNLDHYRSKYAFGLLAYVIMPNHIHLVIRPSSKANISVIMRELKKFSARDIIRQLEEDGREDVLQIFRNSVRRYHRAECRTYQVWADRFDDVALHSDRALQTKIGYIHHNPVRAGLVEKAEDYPYSSAREYASNTEKMGRTGLGQVSPPKADDTHESDGVVLETGCAWHPCRNEMGSDRREVVG